VREEPHVYAVHVESMVAFGKQEHRLAVFEVGEANCAVHMISTCGFVDDSFEASDE